MACEFRLTIGARSNALTPVGSWFYELEFKNVEVIVDANDNSVDFMVNEWPTEGKHTERKVIPPGDRTAVKEEGWACYGDQGSVRKSTALLQSQCGAILISDDTAPKTLDDGKMNMT